MLAEAAVAVFPSYAETFAMAPLEAMACGCPTIYSRNGSGPELMEDARHGLLVEPKRPKEIAAAIVRLLKDRAFARGLGEAGQQRASSLFSMENLLPENVAFYRTRAKEFQAGPALIRGHVRAYASKMTVLARGIWRPAARCVAGRRSFLGNLPPTQARNSPSDLRDFRPATIGQSLTACCPPKLVTITGSYARPWSGENR